jgi:hypothetical protein
MRFGAMSGSARGEDCFADNAVACSAVVVSKSARQPGDCLGLREIPRDSFGLAHCPLIALPSGLQLFDFCLDAPFQPPT